jgi:hypothetical protein
MLDFDTLPASDDVYNFRTGKWEKLASGPNVAPNMAYLGLGIYVMKTVDGDAKRHKAGLERRRASRRQGLVDVGGGLSLGLPALSQETHQPQPVGVIVEAARQLVAASTGQRFISSLLRRSSICAAPLWPPARSPRTSPHRST